MDIDLIANGFTYKKDKAYVSFLSEHWDWHTRIDNVIISQDEKNTDVRIKLNTEVVVRFELETKRGQVLENCYDYKAMPAPLFNGGEQQCNRLLLSVDRQLL